MGGIISGLEYDALDKAPVKLPISITKHLSHLNHVSEYRIKEVFSKDSRHISQSDHDLILKGIKETSYLLNFDV